MKTDRRAYTPASRFSSRRPPGLCMAAAVAILAWVQPAAAQVVTYTGQQITNPTGLLTFTWPGSSGSLANYTESGLRVTCPGTGQGQGCTGGPRGGGGCCVPYGFSHGGWYFGGGVPQLARISRADGGVLSAVEFQAGDYFNGCTLQGDGITRLWAVVLSGGALIAEFDIDVPTGTYVGFTGIFDELRVGAYNGAYSRDLHDPSAIQSIGMDNMRYVASGCPAFGPPATIYHCSDGANTFSVSAFGDAPLSYQWQWQALGDDAWTDVAEGPNAAAAPFAFTASGSQSPTLTRTGALTPGSVALFRCVVSNTCATITGASASLAITPAPIIDEQPQSVALCSPGYAGFSSVALITPSDPGPFTYQWQRRSGSNNWQNLTNGESVSGVTTPYLSWVQEDTTPRHFRCIVTNACSSTTSSVADLTFGNAPTIGVQPEDATTCALGGYAAFDVEEAGVQPVGYQWRVESPPGSAQYLDLTDGTFVDPATGMSFYVYGSYEPYMTISDITLNGHPRQIHLVGVLQSACGEVPSRVTTLTVCAADFNCDGAASVADIFSFIGFWFTQSGQPGAGNPADINGDGSVTVTDIFAFLSVWFTGC